MNINLLRLWLRLKDDSGQDLIEYALLAVLIGLVVAAAFPPITNAITGAFTRAATCLNGAGCVTTGP
jgi:pilus assembly protein Flp/PilA